MISIYYISMYNNICISGYSISFKVTGRYIHHFRRRFPCKLLIYHAFPFFSIFLHVYPKSLSMYHVGLLYMNGFVYIRQERSLKSDQLPEKKKLYIRRHRRLVDRVRVDWMMTLSFAHGHIIIIIKYFRYPSTYSLHVFGIFHIS